MRGDLPVAQSFQPVHEEHLAGPRIDGIERAFKLPQTVLGGQYLIGSRRAVWNRKRFNPLLDIQVPVLELARVPSEIQNGTDQEGLRLTHFPAAVAIELDAQKGFLEQILRLLPR